MLGIKIIGAAFVFLSCTLFGVGMKLKTESRLNSLNNLLSCIQIFENEIRYNISDIVHIIPKITNVANDINSELFEKLLHNNKIESDVPLSKIWTKTVDEICKNSNYNSQDKDILIQFGNVLGSGDVNTQLKNLDLFHSNVLSNVRECEEKNDKNGGFYPKAGIYLGAIIVILLI